MKLLWVVITLLATSAAKDLTRTARSVEDLEAVASDNLKSKTVEISENPVRAQRGTKKFRDQSQARYYNSQNKNVEHQNYHETTQKPYVPPQNSWITQSPIPSQNYHWTTQSPVSPQNTWTTQRPVPPQNYRWTTQSPMSPQNSWATQTPAPSYSQKYYWTTQSPAPAQNYWTTQSPAPAQNYWTTQSPAPAHNYWTTQSPAPAHNYWTTQTPAPSQNYWTTQTPAPSQNYWTTKPAPSQQHWTNQSPVTSQNYWTTQKPYIPPQQTQNHWTQNVGTAASTPTSVVKNEFYQGDNRSYRYEYQLTDGTHVGEEGYFVNPGTENESLVKKGWYSYVGADKYTYLVTYWADHTGYHATYKRYLQQ